MIESKKFRKLIDALNSYYGFAVLVYTVTILIASNSRVAIWIAAGLTPFIFGWTGYVLRSFVEQRNQRYGFTVISTNMTYEISPNHTYTLRYSIKSKAKSDHLMVYPIGYQWSGSGDTSVPKLASKNQYLLTMLKSGNKNKTLTPAPYKVTMSTEKDWHYSFVALNPPVHKNETVEIKYSQNFVDKHATARPYLGYITRVTMQRLELNVKFAPNALPQKVECYYIKPSDPGRPYFTTGVQYDSDKEWATWVVENPKKGYCYRIQWS